MYGDIDIDGGGREKIRESGGGKGRVGERDFYSLK